MPSKQEGRYLTIAMSPAVRTLLPGVNVFGTRVELQPFAEPVEPDWTDHWRRLHERWSGKTKVEVAAQSRIVAYADFYRRIGLNPKETPPSIQNMIQRFLLRETLDRFPTIHPLVDAVNVAAVDSLIPLGAFDAEQVEGEIVLALTEGGEAFQPLGTTDPVTLGSNVLILRDSQKVLSQFCYRDSEHQKIRPQTRSVWLLGCQVPGVDATAVILALEQALQYIQRGYTVSVQNRGYSSDAEHD